MTNRGFLLPVVLLFMVAASGMATVALLVARSEVLLERGDFRFLHDRVRWEAALRSSELDIGLPGEASDGSFRRPLGNGFVLIRSGRGRRPGYQSVLWILDPDSVAAGLPPAGEVGWGIPENGVEWGGEECGLPDPGPLVRVRPTPGPGAPDPPPDPPPRLGPVGIASLLPRARLLLPPGDRYLPLAARELVQVPPGSRLEEGEGHGILLAPGDLILAGEVRWHGLVLVEGDLDLEAEARIEGVALVGGRLRLVDDARLTGCPSRAREALESPGVAGTHPVRGGRLLGRY